MRRRILFVCSGNQCRSPMAAKMLERMLEREGINDVETSSAGTIAMEGETAGEAVLEIGSQLGLDLSGHCAIPVSTELIRECSLILAMEQIHRAVILGMCPDLDDRVKLLRSYAPHSQPGEEIRDPTGMPPLAYRSCFAQIMESLEGLIKELKET